MVHQNRNWEQIASEVKPMTFEQAVKNTGLDFLPKSAFNIYYYHHSYSFFGFKSIVRYEAPREVILKHVDEIIHQYPDLAPCWQEIEISANSNITKSTSVTWFNIENIKNGKKWGCSNSGGQFKGPVGGQQIFVDFDNNLLYFSAHD